MAARRETPPLVNSQLANLRITGTINRTRKIAVQKFPNAKEFEMRLVPGRTRWRAQQPAVPRRGDRGLPPSDRTYRNVHERDVKEFQGT